MRVQGQRPPSRITEKPVETAKAAEVDSAPVAQGWTAKAVRSGAVEANATTTEARNTAAATRFFDAFHRHDLATLEQMYRPDAKFKDDMFTLSKRSSILKMWGGAPPFASFKAEVLEAKGDQVKARWVVDYEMFGNTIHNEIDSTLTFDAEGRVASQDEHWDPSKWMSQALPLIPKFLQPAAYAVMRPLLSMQMGG